MPSFTYPKTIACGGLLCWITIAHTALAVSATSNALIILEADGRHFTVQHTIGSDSLSVALDIPNDATTQHLSFVGPNQTLHQQNHSQSDNPVQLIDGVALARYRHRYEDELTQTGPDTFQLSVPSLPQNFSVEDGNITQSGYTWVLPENLELLNYEAAATDVGQWKLEGKELSYEQTEPFAITLIIEYRVRQSQFNLTASNALTADIFCVPTPDNPDLCASDTDADSVPDYRDVCLSGSFIQSVSIDLPTDSNLKEIAASHSVNSSDERSTKSLIEFIDLPESAQSDESVESTTRTESSWQQLFGCEVTTNVTLSDVQFPSGFSYLDVSSRKALDRLAEALQKTPGYFEIGAHTDNRGPAESNIKLSTKRANTVRYYLLLRGVNPNIIRAKGYGEQFPLFDNESAEGRRDNRRIEILAIQ